MPKRFGQGTHTNGEPEYAHLTIETLNQNLTKESWRTIARERRVRIPARPAVETRPVPTLIHVRLAVGAGEPVGAGAAVAVDQVGADPAVAARVGLALVKVGLAVAAGVAWKKKSYPFKVYVRKQSKYDFQFFT